MVDQSKRDLLQFKEAFCLQPLKSPLKLSLLIDSKHLCLTNMRYVRLFFLNYSLHDDDDDDDDGDDDNDDDLATHPRSLYPFTKESR